MMASNQGTTCHDAKQQVFTLLLLLVEIKVQNLALPHAPCYRLCVNMCLPHLFLAAHEVGGTPKQPPAQHV